MMLSSRRATTRAGGRAPGEYSREAAGTCSLATVIRWPAATAMARRFREAGVPESDIFVGGPRPEKHSAVARIRGRAGSTRKPILLLAHLDVVEALKADWSADLDPFVFTEREGYYYGRGTADDKAMAAIFVANAYRMKQDGFVPDGDIIIALTADEEGGNANGVDWLLQNHPDRIDVGLVISYRIAL